MKARPLFIFMLVLTFAASMHYQQYVYAQTATVQIVATNAPGRTELLAGTSTGSRIINFIGMTIGTTSATAQNVTFVTGTQNNDNCTVGRAVIFGALSGGTVTTVAATGINTATPIMIAGNGLMVIPTSRSFCIEVTGSQAVGGGFTYLQQ